MRKLDPFARLREMAKDDRKAGEKCEEDDYSYEEKKLLLSCFYNAEQQTFLVSVVIREILRLLKSDTGTPSSEQISKTKSPPKHDNGNHTTEHGSCSVCNIREELFKIFWGEIIHKHCVDNENKIEKADTLIDSMWLDMNTVITEVTESQGPKHDYFHDVRADAQEFLKANNFNFDLSDDVGLEVLRKKIINEIVRKITNAKLPLENEDLKASKHLYHMAGIFTDCVGVTDGLTDNGVTCKYDKTSRTASVDFDVCINCFLMANGYLAWNGLKRWVMSLTSKIGLKNGDSNAEIPKTTIRNKTIPNKSMDDGEIVKLPAITMTGDKSSPSRAAPGSVAGSTNGVTNRNPRTPHSDRAKNQMLLAINLKRKSDCTKEQIRKSKRNRKTSSKFLNQFIYDDTDSENEIHETSNADNKTEDTLVKSPTAKKKVSPKKPTLHKAVTMETYSSKPVLQSIPKLQPIDGSLNISLGSTKFLTNSVNKIMKQTLPSDKTIPIKMPSLRKVIIRPKRSKNVEFIKLLSGSSNTSLQPVKLTPMSSNAKMLILAPVSNAKIKPKPITVSTTSTQQKIIRSNLVTSSVKSLPSQVKPTPIIFQNAKQIGSTVTMTKLKNEIHLLPISFPSSIHPKLSLNKVQYTGTKLITSTSSEGIFQVSKSHQKSQTITSAPFKSVLGNIVLTKSPFLKQGIVKLKPITCPMVVPLPKSSPTTQSTKLSYSTTTVQILTDPSEQKLRPADKSPHKRKKIQPDKSMGEVIQEFVQSIIYDEEEAQKTAAAKKWSSNEIPVPYEANFLCIGDTIETNGWKAYWYRRCRCAKVKECETSDSEEKYVPTPAELRLWVKGETDDKLQNKQRFSDGDDDESQEENTEKSEKVSLKSKLVRDKSGNWVLSQSPSKINIKTEKPETSVEKRAKFENELQAFLDKNQNLSDDAMRQLNLAMSSEFEKYLAETKRPMGATNTTFIFHQNRDLTFYNSKLNIIRPTTHCFKDFSFFKNVASRKLRHIHSNHQKLLTKKTSKVKLNLKSSKVGDLCFSMLKSQDIEPQKRRRISQDQPSIKPPKIKHSNEHRLLNTPQISAQSKTYHFHRHRKLTSNKTKLNVPTLKRNTKPAKYEHPTTPKRSMHLESNMNFNRNVIQNIKPTIPKYGHPTTSKHSMHLESSINFIPYADKISDVNVPFNFESEVMSMLESAWGNFSLPVRDRRRTSSKTLNMFTMDNNYVKECIKPLNKWLKTKDNVKVSPEKEFDVKVECMVLDELEHLAEKLEHELSNVTKDTPSTKKTEKVVETIDLTVDKVNNKRSLCNFGTIVAVAKGVVVNKPKQADNAKTGLSNRSRNSHCDKKKKLNATDVNMNNISSNVVGELVYADIPSLPGYRSTTEENYEVENSYEVTHPPSPANQQSYVCQSETYIKDFHYQIPPEEAQNVHGLSNNVLDISESNQETTALQMNEEGDEDDWEYDTDSESSGISSDEDEECNSSEQPIVISDSSNDDEDIVEITSSEDGENKSYKSDADENCDTTSPLRLGDQDSSIMNFGAKLLLTPCDDEPSQSISKENSTTRRSLRKRKQTFKKDEDENTKTQKLKQKQHSVNEEHDMQITRKRGRPKLQALRKRVFAKIQNQELSPPSTNEHNEELLKSEQFNRRLRKATLQKLKPSSFSKRSGNTRKIKEKFSTNGSFISQLISSDE